ncbi:hypothetical protein [Legionella sainthelensi]|uniref:hypothetical protein n=1 Tax=Legionella sainthelensi TaxID=28087 RepID=UPI000E206DEA|nr:hypothetical protein [Legionella sainthelensi]
MQIKNTYKILSKRYPLRLKTARKALIQLFIQKDLHPHHEDAFLFNRTELINITYTNIWFALEGFIDLIHAMFGIEELDNKGRPKLLAQKLSEIRKTIIESDPNIINFQDKENIPKFIQDRDYLNEQFRLTSDEVNNVNEFKSKKKRNSLNHLPAREGTSYSEHHATLEESELAKFQFYASEIIDTHIIYGLTHTAVKRLYDLIDNFMRTLDSFIKNHINNNNLSLYEENNQDILFQLSILNSIIYSEYDDESMLCSGSQTLI